MNLINKTIELCFCMVFIGFLGFCVIQAEAADDPPTELYVRTTPEGAKVFLDGKQVGVAPGLFKVEPGSAKIVVKLEGLDSIEREVEIKASHVTRVELEFKKQPASTASSKTDSAPDAQNILKNPGFEAGDNAPDDWQQGAAIEGVKYSWDKKVAFEGKASLCIEKTAPRYFPIAEWSQTVERQGDRPALMVSAQVKAQKMTKAILDVIFLDENGTPIAHKWAAFIGVKEPGEKSANHDWQQYSGKVEIPAETKKLSIALQVYGPGKIWFDDVRASYADKPAPDPHNILKNPAFEDGVISPDNWEQGAEIEGVKYSWDKKVACEGKASVCIEKTAKKYFPIAEWSQTVERKGDKSALMVSAQVKAKKMTKAILDVAFLDENAMPISHEWIAFIGIKETGDKPADHDWKLYSGKVNIPPYTKKLSIALQVYGPGKVWFDDVRADYTYGLKSDTKLPPAAQIPIASKTSSSSEAAEKLLRNYAETVWKELPPKLDKANLSNDEASKIAVQTTLEIAARHILPHKDIVDKYLLDQMQKGPPIDPSIWNSASVIKIPESTKAEPGWNEGFWNPIVVLYSFQNIALIEKLGNEEAMKYLVLGSCAPVPMLLIDDNLDKPEFVSIYPKFLVIYRLERDQKGLYRPSEIRQTSQSGMISYKDLPSDLSPERKAFWEYSCKVWDELLPKLDSLKTDEIYEAASRVAESELASKRDILKEEAAKTLAKLTKAKSFDRSQWHSKLDDKSKQDNLEKAQLALSKYGMLPIRWNPVQLASQIKMTLIAASKNPEAIGKLAMVSAAATQSLDQAIDPDPEHPIIAMPAGNDIFIIHLRRNEAGLYDFVDFEWLTAETKSAATSSEKDLPNATVTEIVQTAAGKDPGTDLQELINKAKPGAVVTIPPGVYREPITIDKPLTLKGDNPEKCVLELTADQPAVTVSSKGPVIIDSISIKWQLATSEKQKEPACAISVKDGNADIRNCRLTALGNFTRCPSAVQCLGISKLKLDKCRFEGFDFCINYTGGAEGSITDCLILNPGHCGITVYSGSRIDVARNIVTGSGFHGLRCTGGVLLAHDNLIIKNENRGIYLGNKSARGSVNNNVIMSNTTGISAFGQSAVTIENNLILNSSFAGLDTRDSCQLIVKNNVFQENSKAIVLFAETGKNQVTFAQNSFWKNTTNTENVDMPKNSILVDPRFEDPKNGNFTSKDEELITNKQGLSNPGVIRDLWKRWEALSQEK
jgi:hypothetical protein